MVIKQGGRSKVRVKIVIQEHGATVWELPVKPPVFHVLLGHRANQLAFRLPMDVPVCLAIISTLPEQGVSNAGAAVWCVLEASWTTTQGLTQCLTPKRLGT